MSPATILHGLNYGLDYLRELVADLTAAELVRQPSGFANHALWTIGHLTFILQEIGQVAGVAPWLEEEHVRLFGPGSVPVADPAAYPAKAACLAMLEQAESKIVEAMGHLEPKGLAEPFPDPAYADVFPTVGHAFNQVLVAHTAFHVGQVAVWRRAGGYPSIGRSFE